MRSRLRSVVAAGVVGVIACVPTHLAAAGTRPEDVTDRDFAAQRFNRSDTVDNRWDPLVPGTQLVYQGQADRGGGLAPHKLILVVTGLTKVVNGVQTVVLWERDINDGQLVEEELAFHAQDDAGNVWNMGEYPEESEDGKFTGAPNTWISGKQGARPGIMMRAKPEPGTPVYRAGFAPAIDFADKTEVVGRGRHTCVPLRCFDDLLQTREWNPLERADGQQLKLYAAGVGNVRVDPVGGDELESLVLVKAFRLGREGLAEANEAALRLDRRAYRYAAGVYGDTPPAKWR